MKWQLPLVVVNTSTIRALGSSGSIIVFFLWSARDGVVAAQIAVRPIAITSKCFAVFMITSKLQDTIQLSRQPDGRTLFRGRRPPKWTGLIVCKSIRNSGLLLL